MNNEFIQINNNQKHNSNNNGFYHYDIENYCFDNNIYNSEEIELNILSTMPNISTYVSPYQIKKSISYPNVHYKKYDIELCMTKNKILQTNTNRIINQNPSSNVDILMNSSYSTELNDTSNLLNSSDSHDFTNTNDSFIKKLKYLKIHCYLIKLYNFCGLNIINYIEIMNKLLSVFLHIFIMVIFEIYFYFNYVVLIEKNEFIDKINSYLIEFESNVAFNQVQKDFIKLIIKTQNHDQSFITYLYNQYLESLEKQKALLDKLLIFACKMGGVIGIILLVLFGFGLANRKKISWKWILIENFIMFALLGIFEYLFFTNIILHYNPITDEEVKYFVANSLYNYFNSTIY